MTDELVHYEVERGIATVTLDSPANRNALSAPLVAQLAGHLAAARQDDGVRGVVLTATGTTFCAGADLKNPPGTSSATGPTFAGVLSELWSFPKTVLVALNGHVRAGGTGLVACGDVVVAPDDATFGFSEVRIGVAPAIIAAVCQRVMPPRAARRWMLTGEPFGAAEAVEAGLVTVAVPRGELDATAASFADAMRLAEPTAVRETKALLAALPALSMEAGLEHAASVSARLFSSPAAAEGIAAMREKRPPSWVSELGSAGEA